MSDADDFAVLVFEEAKRFLEKARREPAEEGQTAYLHACLLLGYGALEAHINSIAADFADRQDIAVLDQSILQEKEFTLKSGRFELTDSLKMYRLEDRLEFIFRYFSKDDLDKNQVWWGSLKEGLQVRNAITHPREPRSISVAFVSRVLESILECFDVLYRAVYHRGYPSKGRQLDSKLDF